MNLITPYYCIATSGETNDGREISAEWLTSMAENYDPSESEALLWKDHSRWRDPAGSVVSLKTEIDEKQRVKLFATIRPTPRLLNETKYAEVPFKFSIEVAKRADGSFYLDGLAYTHDPASLGVDSMAFSKERPEITVITGENVEKLEFKKKSLFGSIFEKSDAFTKPHQKQDEPEMTPEQEALLKELNEGLKTFGAEFTEVKEQIQEVKADIGQFRQELSGMKLGEFTTKSDEIRSALEAQDEKITGIAGVVEEIGNASTGRFKRRPATGGESDAELDALA